MQIFLVVIMSYLVPKPGSDSQTLTVWYVRCLVLVGLEYTTAGLVIGGLISLELLLD